MKETSYLTDSVIIAVFARMANYIANYLWASNLANARRQTEERLFTIAAPASMMPSHLRRN
jgi:hypothetical protein